MSEKTDGEEQQSPPAEEQEGDRRDVLEPPDLAESSGSALDSATKTTSDALYILREQNYLFELQESLENHGIELKEEA